MKWRQRAKRHWYKRGDHNTNYFHACVNQCHSQNYIQSIVDVQNNTQVEANKIEEAFSNYFTKLFTSVASTSQNINLCTKEIQPKVNAIMNEKLLKNFTKEKVESALNQVAPLKAPRPYGFCAVFDQRHWKIVGQEVSEVV